jgi:hypothetical protein
MYIHKFICHQRAIPKEHTLTKRADELELELLSKRAQDEPELELELRAIQAMSGHVRLTNRADELELELLSKRAQDDLPKRAATHWSWSWSHLTNRAPCKCVRM